jgi:predicted membrane protein
MFRFMFKVIRALAIAAVGTAIAAKLLLESNAEPGTEEIDLISIFERQHLVSEAASFYGGKVMAMFGGVMLDLRNATPAPTGIYLDLAVVMGGVSLIVPEGWRVKFTGNVIMGGFSDETHTTAEDDVPTVTLGGFVFMGGVQATTRPPVDAKV